MTDIALVADAAGNVFDIDFGIYGFDSDDGLETAIIISLFTDRRLPAGVEHPEGLNDPRGYWGDAAETDGFQWGSLLWTLYRQIITNAVIASCREFCEQALQWTVDDGIAESVTVTAERAGTYQISISIQIVKKDTRETLRYAYLWDGQQKGVSRVV